VCGFFSKASSVFAVTTLRFRAWPLDCDFNLHLTNSRYLSFMDLGRTFYVAKHKMIRKILKNKWLTVVAASEITFIRPIKPLQKFTLTTELITWDEKYQYFYHRFCKGKNIYATALVKTAAYSKGKAVASEKIVALTGQTLAAPPIPESIQLFKQLSMTKRRVHG
jgi:acyl-CoA thioesterase FadM